MSKHTTEVYYCDRCGKEMGTWYRKIKTVRSIEDLWKPRTWGKTNTSGYEVCHECFDSFLSWVHKQKVTTV